MLKLLTATASAAVLAIATPALAEPITIDAGSIGDSFTIDYDGFADGQNVDGLGASTTFTVVDVTDTGYTFGYAVTNNSGNGVDSNITSFAFNTNPDIFSATATGAYSFVVTDSNYPNGIGNVDVCFKSGRSGSCAGNSGGIGAGDTGTGMLTLSFSQPITSLTLDDFFVRYQSISGAGNVTSASGQQTSSTTTGGSTTTTSSSGGTSGTPVPEPGMLGLFGAALIGLGLARRRRRGVPA